MINQVTQEIVSRINENIHTVDRSDCCDADLYSNDPDPQTAVLLCRKCEQPI